MSNCFNISILFYCCFALFENMISVVRIFVAVVVGFPSSSFGFAIFGYVTSPCIYIYIYIIWRIIIHNWHSFFVFIVIFIVTSMLYMTFEVLLV